MSREYRAVYRVGHAAPSLEAGYLAAVKAGGSGAQLCDAAAGCLPEPLVRRGIAPVTLSVLNAASSPCFGRRS